ncbi:MAG: hypothetical protein DCC69_09145 [Hyphomicrobiales bacterium]|nr:MAG: hypothetical protein DCC69_09145 [Hyphomicrobiales bacterium]
MNIAHAGAAGLLAALALAAGAFQPNPELDTTATSSVAPAMAAQESFRLVSTWSGAGGGAGCSLAAGNAAEGGSRPLRLAPGCIADNPALAEARYWLDRPDGTVAFSGADGRVLAEFAAADGAAFESYHPRLPVMTLFADD